MSERRKRRNGGKRRPAEGAGSRYLRPRLPDESFGKVVPVEFQPRYSSMVVGDGEAPVLFDVSALRRVSIPNGRTLTIEVVTTDDPDLGWGGRPVKRRRRAAARRALRRRAGKIGPIREQSSKRGLKTRGRTREGRGA